MILAAVAWKFVGSAKLPEQEEWEVEVEEERLLSLM
jgi:hypothetical protein